MRIYTKTGDKGDTSFFGGERVSKDDVRIEAYGAIDELNTILGIVRAASIPEGIDRILGVLQNHLFVVGADLATPLDKNKNSKIPRIGAEHTKLVEQFIDMSDAQLPELKNFILPVGTEVSARLHFARAVCRRAERLVVGATRRAILNPEVIVYLNRLSDLLFVLARRANHEAGVMDIPWSSE